MKVLVIGFYNHYDNLGDELFKEAFQVLFPNAQLVFTDHITSTHLDGVDVVFFGGGSLLQGKPLIDSVHTLSALMSKRIYYIGVGVEKEIHPHHIKFLQSAELIATRSLNQVDRLKELNPNTIWMPDLVFALQDKVQVSQKIDKSVLIIPNSYVVPKIDEPQYKHAAWNYFKSEFAQFLDTLVDNKYQLNFLSLCNGSTMPDTWAAYEILSCMTKSNQKMVIQNAPTIFQDASDLFSRHQTIISQRYHGMILSEMVKAPYIGITHHDKLKDHEQVSQGGEFISYYNCSKQALLDAFNKAQQNTTSLKSYASIFDTLKQKVKL
jgi:polysaccharide pyruvyl transferase WcaK-like protein